MGWTVLFVTGLFVVSTNAINIKYGYTDSELAAFIANTVSSLHIAIALYFYFTNHSCLGKSIYCSGKADRWR